VVIPHPRHESLEGGLLTWDDQGCQDCVADLSPNVSGQVLKGVTAGSNVRGVDYRTAGRMALSATKKKESHVHFCSENKHHIQPHGDKAHILRKGDRWIRCHSLSGGLSDVLP
jgi:hypothetical protein